MEVGSGDPGYLHGVRGVNQYKISKQDLATVDSDQQQMVPTGWGPP